MTNKVGRFITEVDAFDKYTIRISVKQAEILLDLIRKLDMSEMTTEGVYAANSIHYSLQAIKEQAQNERA